ncbi:hypothetical protein NIES208_05860 [[Limnothrix rosea] IAM M-220]|nr:hypothetical protein NIES208_05860 [[Limnothrix rosea] IAM M-220]
MNIKSSCLNLIFRKSQADDLFIILLLTLLLNFFRLWASKTSSAMNELTQTFLSTKEIQQLHWEPCPKVNNLPKTAVSLTKINIK